MERISATELDDRVLRARVVEHIRAAIDFTWYAWVLTDPRSCVGRASSSEPPEQIAVTELYRLKYLTRPRRWTGLLTDRVVTVVGDRDQPHGELWDALLQPHGVTDVLSLVLRDAYGCWGYLDLWRTTGAFRPDEIGLMTGLAPSLTRGVRRSVAATFAAASARSPADGGGELFLTDDLVPAGGPEETSARRALVPTSDDDDATTPVPSAALHVGAQLLASEAGVDDHPASARVHLGQGRWMTVQAQRPADPDATGIVVATGPTDQADRAELFSRANGLSRRESQVLDLLLRGGRTRDLAEAMRVSQHTVQDHLKAVFTKTGTHSRPALVQLAAGMEA